MTRIKLYRFILIACGIGYIWIIYNLLSQTSDLENYSVCIIKNITGVPCPSCGSTRGVLEILNGRLYQALLLNPLSFIVLFGVLLIPLWISFDFIIKSSSFYLFFKKTEEILRKPKLVLFLIFLMILNWVWNIYKNL